MKITFKFSPFNWFRLLADHAEKSLEDNKTRLSKRDLDLRNTTDRVLQLETQVAESQRQVQLQHDEISRLRNTLASLDQEKDALQASVEDKTERIVRLEEELITKVPSQSCSAENFKMKKKKKEKKKKENS